MKNQLHILAAIAVLLPALAGAASLDLTWQDNSDNETGFLIERRIVSEGVEFEVLDRLLSEKPSATGDTRYIDRSCLPGVTYEYRVAAYNDYGISEYSNTVQGAAGAGPKAPGLLKLSTVPAVRVWKSSEGDIEVEIYD